MYQKLREIYQAEQTKIQNKFHDDGIMSCKIHYESLQESDVDK